MKKPLALFVVIWILFFAIPAWAGCKEDVCKRDPIQLAMSPALLGIAGAGGAAACGASLFEDAFASNDYSAWTGEVDTGSLLTAASGASVFTHTAKTAGYSTKTLASAVTESWVQFDIAFSDNAMGGNGTYMQIILFRDGGDNSAAWVEMINNTAGTLTNLALKFVNDAAGTVLVGTYALSPASGTTYTLKLHSKASSDADTDNGELTLYTCSAGSCTSRITSSTLDYYARADLYIVRLGNAASTFSDTSGKTITWDNFEWRSDDCF